MHSLYRVVAAQSGEEKGAVELYGHVGSPAHHEQRLFAVHRESLAGKAEGTAWPFSALGLRVEDPLEWHPDLGHRPIAQEQSPGCDPVRHHDHRSVQSQNQEEPVHRGHQQDHPDPEDGDEEFEEEDLHRGGEEDHHGHRAKGGALVIGEEVGTLRPASEHPRGEAPPQSWLENEEAGEGERRLDDHGQND